jgi:hypothetical protein
MSVTYKIRFFFVVESPESGLQQNTSKLAEIGSKLPVTRSEEDELVRDEMFADMDQNGSGRVSLAEVSSI